jgi:hypothetical protein
MIHKDAVVSAAKHDVGVIDGDPLYDAQDMEIKNFAIGQASVENGKAKVPVTFENLGDKKTLIFTLVNRTSGWRISDIDYGEGRTLVGEFKKPNDEIRNCVKIRLEEDQPPRHKDPKNELEKYLNL